MLFCAKQHNHIIWILQANSIDKALSVIYTFPLVCVVNRQKCENRAQDFLEASCCVSPLTTIWKTKPKQNNQEKLTMPKEPKDIIGATMVVGGGIAGMQSALDLAESGYYVYLVEKSSAIGGLMSQLDKTFPTNDCAM
jgi:heterodisulfide reductase subunit A-like polyferredoxin